ncbi:MAG: hypothetical protein PVJ57_03870 [Phycisphaerae bacterium]
MSTAGDPQRPALSSSWLGTIFLLAYLPDVLEWLARLAGLRFPHSAPAALPVLLVTGTATLLILRFVCREYRWRVLLIAFAAVASHTVLDLLAGGIPYLWPLSGEIRGPDWLQLGEVSGERRFLWECRLFLPVLAVGLAVALVRYSRRTVVEYAAVVGGLAAIGLAVAGSSLLVACVTGALGVTAVVLVWPRIRIRHLWNLVLATPVIILAGVQVLAWDQMRRGQEWDRAGDPERALTCYSRVLALRPVDLETIAVYRAAVCQQRLRRNDEAEALFRYGEALRPDWPYFLLGRMDLYLDSADRDPSRAREVIRLADEFLAQGHDELYRAKVEARRKRARRLLGEG